MALPPPGLIFDTMPICCGTSTHISVPQNCTSLRYVKTATKSGALLIWPKRSPCRHRQGPDGYSFLWRCFHNCSCSCRDGLRKPGRSSSSPAIGKIPIRQKFLHMSNIMQPQHNDNITETFFNILLDVVAVVRPITADRANSYNSRISR